MARFKLITAAMVAMLVLAGCAGPGGNGNATDTTGDDLGTETTEDGLLGTETTEDGLGNETTEDGLIGNETSTQENTTTASDA